MAKQALKEKDKKAEEAQEIKEEKSLFKKEKRKPKGGNEERYNALIQENKLLFTIDLIKEKLKHAYGLKDETQMKSEIIELCESVENRHSIGSQSF